MNKTCLIALSCALCLALAACTDDESTDAATLAPPSTPLVDASTPNEASDASTVPSDGSAPVARADGATASATAKAIPLIEWVDDLIDHHTRDDATPDTVDDKNIADDEDPTKFAGRFHN
jgi:hypothetical protein